jgi:hypothetical protein
VFENEMNIAIIETEKSYNAFMFRAALMSGFYEGSKKPKKGAAPAPPAEEKKMSIGLIYVDEHYSGWKEQCLRVLQSKFDSQSRSFAPNKEIAEALKECPIGQEMNLKQVQKLCMPFIKKKEGPGIGGWSYILVLIVAISLKMNRNNIIINHVREHTKSLEHTMKIGRALEI